MSSSGPGPGPDALSRPRSGILTPTSEGSINRNDAATTSSHCLERKRRDSVAMDRALKPSIALKAHPHNLQVQPRSLQPLMLLPREHLSLSFIDTLSPLGDLPQCRFFESHIKILDLETRMGSTGTVLIARSESKRYTYAVERHPNGLYVACKLGSWVDLEELADLATVVCRDRLQQPKTEPAATNEPSSDIIAPIIARSKTKMTAIEAIQSLVKKRGRSQSVSTFDDGPMSERAVEHEAIPSQNAAREVQTQPQARSETQTSQEAPDQDVACPQQTSDSIFDTIRAQYAEALYKSKGSLAYFAKGTLSRARSAFLLDLEANLDMADLIDFLKSLILTTVQIDKKYREVIPDIIAKMKPIMDSSDEGPKKRRRPKKMKLNKDGLYPLEDESIQRWWAANKPELRDEEVTISLPQIKSHVSLLRTRETQLQMILILEILALEPLKAPELAADTGLPALPGTEESQDQMAAPPVLKKRNKHNLPVLVDVHADRLTIWQSTASDEMLLFEDSQIPSQHAHSQAEKASSEPLKDFCVDVIVPFYAARLPELCDSLSKKLGGPVIISPPKKKSQKRPSKRDQKPGAATKRPAVRQEHRTLERALSFDAQHRRSMSRGPSNAIALMRSATPAVLTSFKREDSEPALSKLPAAREDSRKRTLGLTRSISMANVDEARAAKKAKVDAELKDAISALRKPNRDVVSKAMEEAAERKASAGGAVKKPRKPQPRPSLGSSVQVMATPATNRFKDIMAPAFGTPVNLFAQSANFVPPSSAGTLIPSTAPRNAHKDALETSSSVALGATPVKPSQSANFLRRPAYDEVAIPPSSPLMPRRTGPMDSPMVQDSAVKPKGRLFATQPREELLETPVKRTAARPDGTSQNENMMSIYQRLGWDDDLDDPL